MMMMMMMVMVMLAGSGLHQAPVLVLGQNPGGLNDISLEPEDSVVLFAVEQIQTTMNLGSDVALVSVEDAKRQVTDRVTYHLKLRMSGGYVCDIKVVDYWAVEGLTVKGQPHCLRLVGHLRSTLRERGLLGGVSEPRPLPQGESQEVSSVMDALDAAVCALGQTVSGNKAFKVADVSDVTYTSQVTVGVTYRFYNVPLAETTCSQTVCHRDDLATCEALSQHKKRCDFEVQHTPGPNRQFRIKQNRNPACIDLE